MKFGFDWPSGSEEKMFEIVNERTTRDGQTPEHGYTISSPCEPEGSEGSGELIKTEHF